VTKKILSKPLRVSIALTINKINYGVLSLKKSVIISFKVVVSRALAISAAGVFLAGTCYFDIPGTVLGKMAENVIKTGESANDANFLTNLLSFEPRKNIMLPYGAAIAAKPETPPTDDKVTNPSTEAQAAATPEEEATPANTDLSDDKGGSAVSSGSITVKNFSGKSINIDTLLRKPLNFNAKSGGYKVLIVHSHTTESYFPNDRSEDQSKNIVRVGDEFTKILNDSGIKTLHVKKVHDVPYTLSYKNSLETVTKTLAENPSIEVVIDVHRDAIYDKNENKLKPLVTLNNEKCAQVMIVTGSGALGLPHANWQDNLSFSLKVQDKMLKEFKGLARPVNLAKERYNTHTTKSSIIFEIGANGNTLEEALNGAKRAAKAVAEVLLGK
jgi:stage II sporulation protein P